MFSVTDSDSLRFTLRNPTNHVSHVLQLRNRHLRMFASNPQMMLSARAESEPVRMPGTVTASPVSPTTPPPGAGFGLKIGRVMMPNWSDVMTVSAVLRPRKKKLPPTPHGWLENHH